MAWLELLIGILTIGFFPGLFVLFILFLMSVRVVYEYERYVLFRLGKFQGVLGPGLRIILPIIDSTRSVDMRITTVDIPKQEVITKDNVPVGVNAVVYFKVSDPSKAVLNIQDYAYAVAQYAQTALRDVIGKIEMDDLLAEREVVAQEIEKIVDVATSQWGLDVTGIKIQDLELPADMKRAMARQAEAEREKRANIITAEGEKIAAENLSKAADQLFKSPGALHLRTLQTISDVSPDPSNTIIFALPIEVLRALEGLTKKEK